MKAKAEKLGANAVIRLQFQTSVIMGGAAEMMAYGTAVVVEEKQAMTIWNDAQLASIGLPTQETFL